MNEELQNGNGNGNGNIVLQNGRKLFWAGLGAVAMTQDEISKLAKSLVTRGEEFGQENRERFDRIVTNPRENVVKFGKNAEEEFEKRFEAVVQRLHVPTKEDIKRLNSKITRLTKKVDELVKSAA